MENRIIFKGTKDGIVIVIKENMPFSEIKEFVDLKIMSAIDFFKNSEVVVKIQGGSLNEAEYMELEELLTKKYGLKFGGRILASEEHPRVYKAKIFDGIDEGRTKFIKNTVRSGQKVHYNGNIVVIGDVNPGGEVIAAGNVIIMGSLRGLVHAGATGNRNAVVVAFRLQPLQLRIADVITRAPDEKTEPKVPEIAYIKDGQIFIDSYLTTK